MPAYCVTYFNNLSLLLEFLKKQGYSKLMLEKAD